MPNAASTLTGARPLPLTGKLSRFLVGVVALLFCFSGEKPQAACRELTEEQLQARLADRTDPLNAMIERLETDMTRGDVTWPESLVDHDAILCRATDRGAKVEEGVRGIFHDGTLKAWDEKALLKEYEGSTFRYMRTRSFKKRPGLLFRAAGENGSLNYCLFTISEPEKGDYRISDIYVLGVNEFMSDTLNRTWQHLLASFDDEANANGGTPLYVANLGKIAAISGMLRDGQWKEAIDGCKSLPAELRRERSVLLLRIEAAEKYSIGERSEALEEWLTAFPDEMDLPLKLADHYICQERWNDAERVLNGMMMRVGEDSRLLFQIGDVRWKREQSLRWVEAASPATEPGNAAARTE